MNCTLGPLSGLLREPLKLDLSVEGDRILSCETERGFCEKKLEEKMESSPWSSSLVIADHLDNDNAIFTELVFCNAVEKITKVKVPERVQNIRILICELTRISSHLYTLFEMAMAAGSATAAHFLLRDREKILDLLELLSGARFSHRILAFGGIALEVSEGFLERSLEAVRLLRENIPEYNGLFTFHSAFLFRAAKRGVLGPHLVKKHGITGPNARAAGVREDARKTPQNNGYERLDFMVPVGSGEYGALGDTCDRAIIRIREIAQSIDLVAQLVESTTAHTPKFDIEEKNYQKIQIPPGEGQSEIETPRGVLTCRVISDGGDKPKQVKFRAAGLGSFQAIPDLLRGESTQDLPLIMASLGISISEVDG